MQSIARNVPLRHTAGQRWPVSEPSGRHAPTRWSCAQHGCMAIIGRTS
jgi:hypothetical protein